VSSVERYFRILEHLADVPSDDLWAQHLGEVCATVTRTSGAAIMILSGSLVSGSWCTTDATSRLIEDLQFTFGEGPCVEAHMLGKPLLEPDLADPEVRRWPAFTPPVLAAGARAIFGFPVRIGAARLGALNLYRDAPGRLDAEQHADALVLADMAARAILAVQADAPPDELAAELEAGANFHLEVHQAAGMVAVQADCSVVEALVRLRGYAFRNDRSIADVAEDVVRRHLTFTMPEATGS
jgi:GAF domain-containing protein